MKQQPRLLGARGALGAVLLLALIFILYPTRHLVTAASCRLPVDAGASHPGMAWVPGGTIAMGSNVYPEEAPVRETAVQGFWMDRTEVTNREFSEFVNATHYVTAAERPDRPGAAVFVVPSGNVDLSSAAAWWHYATGANWRHPGGSGTSIDGRDDFPVVAITYQDALAYAAWKGRRLPSESQWERAARAGAPSLPEHEQPKSANTWQGIFPIIDTAEDGFSGLAPVGCFQPNSFGLYDMIGNVWELTTDVFASHTPAARVIKGGSFLCAPNYCMRYRPAARQPQEEDLGTSHTGFRTILPVADR